MPGEWGRGAAVGFGFGIAWWEDGLTQAWAVAHRVWLAGGPHPLAVDCSEDTSKKFSAVWPQALVLVGLIVGTVRARRLEPNSAEARFNFGILRARTGDLAGAQRAWARALELKPDYPEARASLERLRDYLRRAPAVR